MAHETPPAVGHSQAEASGQSAVSEALRKLQENNPQATDGKWLEELSAKVGPHLADWDVNRCWMWKDWQGWGDHFEGKKPSDPGIDVVAERRSGDLIAIQCKARRLDEEGRGANIRKGELEKFISASRDRKVWPERWLVTNGGSDFGHMADALARMGKDEASITVVNLHNEVLQQQAAWSASDEECPHCAPDADEEAVQTKQCMQDEAVRSSVETLQRHLESESGGLPKGQARGRIILPCGTGKTRVSLRIVERLTPAGGLSLVMCPSIALVAQIRREYLQNAKVPMRVMSVCSDQTAGYDAKPERPMDLTADPTQDGSNASADWIKGIVTTDPNEIAEWIANGRGGEDVNVIFGTYQSGRRMADALAAAGETLHVLIADEAHRTAGLRLRKSRSAAVQRKLTEDAEKLSEFTLCHDNDAFPAQCRIYQTATPRIYKVNGEQKDAAADWVVRSMDDEAVFGVELYRRSYADAVRNKWLVDYKIIALGVNDKAAYKTANSMARSLASKRGRKGPLTSADCLRGLAFALAMGGGARWPDRKKANLRSCIAFMNTVAKSKDMAMALKSAPVRTWAKDWMWRQHGGVCAQYSLEHLDASHNVGKRENAKRKLAEGTLDKPQGIINVGIFGEGTDSPSLSAVGFLESRKSPIDVVQAVGRAMRTAKGKDIGYIICPIIIPPDVDPEGWLSNSSPEHGWRELGDILLALRAHDRRIEDNLANVLEFHLPKPPSTTWTFIGLADEISRRMRYYAHEGAKGEAAHVVDQVVRGALGAKDKLKKLNEVPILSKTKDDEDGLFGGEAGLAKVITGKRLPDGDVEIREGQVARKKPKAGETLGTVDLEATKKAARSMVNEGKGQRITLRKRNKKPLGGVIERAGQNLLSLSGMGDHGEAIKVNLLKRSGLSGGRMERDANIMAGIVAEAARHLREDDLRHTLNDHLLGPHRKAVKRKSKQPKRKAADGCTIAALLLLNAAMLHQRIAAGKWLAGVDALDAIKDDTDPIDRSLRCWEKITRHDFMAVLAPAVDAIHVIKDTGKKVGLERALHHIAAEAGRIAETYADMGSDHAGALFNKVMGDQDSDGAYFTRPPAAALAAKLALDACGPVKWRDEGEWRRKAVDLACGSGTLLAALLSEMKRRAGGEGANQDELAHLQKIAVEDGLKGLDVNPVSLQLAAAQLTQGNRNIRYRRMGLHLMPYGPVAEQDDGMTSHAGTLELLGQSAIVPHGRNLVGDADAPQTAVAWEADDATLEDAVEAVADARIVIMNPPFTNRTKMGEKFADDAQKMLRVRADALSNRLTEADALWSGGLDKNSIRPMFAALADKCSADDDAVVCMVLPTIALVSPAGVGERLALAKRFHVHTMLTLHIPKNINLSQGTSINESILVLRRSEGRRSATRIIALDKMPRDTDEAEELHDALRRCESGGLMGGGWGEVSHWPADRIVLGDWSAAGWRSPELAEASHRLANLQDMTQLGALGCAPHATGQLLRSDFREAADGDDETFPIVKSKSGGDAGQMRIQGVPDQCWTAKDDADGTAKANLLAKAGHLLVTAGQGTDTGRLTAVAGGTPYVGNGWIPVTGLSTQESAALAVFLNSSAGRLQIMRTFGKKLVFPAYSIKATSAIKVPDVKAYRDMCKALADCFDATNGVEVPQYRDGGGGVREQWDRAVAKALEWDADELTHWGRLLADEPHVRGLGRGQYADAG